MDFFVSFENIIYSRYTLFQILRQQFFIIISKILLGEQLNVIKNSLSRLT